MKPANYDGITKAALQFMRENLSKPIAVPDIAKAVHYSKFHLEVTFRKTTGVGVRENLIQMRMNRAKAVLMQTNIPIGEVAYSVGYSDPAYFSAAFKLREGITPALYRTRSQAAGDTAISAKPMGTEAPDLSFFDTFGSAMLADWWDQKSGQWQIRQGFAECTDKDAWLVLKKPLPENFRAIIEFSVIGAPGVVPADLFFSLTRPSDDAFCYRIHFGANENTINVLSRTGGAFALGMSLMQQNSKALIRPGTWQKAQIELSQNRLNFLVDGQEVFVLRDPFPPAYSLRSGLDIRMWRNTLRLRKVSIEDLGFSPTISAIRQGDLLYGEGLYERALEFYMRYLQSNRDAMEIAELYYKIGMCCLSSKRFAQARERFDKISAVARGSFWDICAQLALLEILWETGDVARFEERSIEMFPNHDFQGDIRRLIYNSCENADSNGFHELAARIMRILVRMEEPGSFMNFWARQTVGNSLILLNRQEEAKQNLEEALKCPKASVTVQSYTRFSLADILAIMGHFNESEDRLKEIETSQPTPFNVLRCQIQRGRNLCANGEDEAGLALLTIGAKSGEISEAEIFAQLLSSLVHTARKDPENARKAIEDARGANPNSYYLQKGTISRFLYPVLFLEKDLEAAAAALKDDAYAGDSPSALRAEQAIKAGILLELAGKKPEAKALWIHTSQRFTEVQCPFFGALASRLAASADDQVDQMPFPVANRIEMFYLVGLLWRARGNEKRAQQLFTMTIEEDHMRLWPSRWAKDAVRPKNSEAVS